MSDAAVDRQPPTTGEVLDQEFEMVPVRSLKLHPRNPNDGDLGAIMDSVSTNGFWGAIVVQKSTKHVLVGNHRLVAARELAIPELPVLWVDVNDEEALRMLVADNRTARLGTDRDEALAEILLELAHSDIGLAGTAYDASDLDELLRDKNPENPVGNDGASAAIEVVVECRTPELSESFGGDLMELGFPISKLVISCPDADWQTRLADGLAALGYTVTKRGGPPES